MPKVPTRIGGAEILAELRFPDALNALEKGSGDKLDHAVRRGKHSSCLGPVVGVALAHQYSSASMMVSTRFVTEGSAGSGECAERS